jgi:hypothetical protein
MSQGVKSIENNKLSLSKIVYKGLFYQAVRYCFKKKSIE